MRPGPNDGNCHVASSLVSALAALEHGQANLTLTVPRFGDSPASLRCVNPTLNISPDATSFFLKPGHLANGGNFLAIRAMPNDERSRAWEIA